MARTSATLAAVVVCFFASNASEATAHAPVSILRLHFVMQELEREVVLWRGTHKFACQGDEMNARLRFMLVRGYGEGKPYVSDLGCILNTNVKFTGLAPDRWSVLYTKWLELSYGFKCRYQRPSRLEAVLRSCVKFTLLSPPSKGPALSTKWLELSYGFFKCRHQLTSKLEAGLWSCRPSSKE